MLIPGPPRMDAMHIPKGTLISERYRIERRIGAGAFGTVFAANHLLTGQPIALKILSTGMDEDDSGIVRFFHEARVTAQLSHPNTIRVFDFGQDDTGLIYLAMEALKRFRNTRACYTSPQERPRRAIAPGTAVAKAVSMIQAYLKLAGLVANSPLGEPLHALGKMLSPMRLLGEDFNNAMHDPGFKALQAYGKSQGGEGGGAAGGMDMLKKIGL